MDNSEHAAEIRRIVAKRIYNVLLRQDFKDWYDSKFEAYITGDLEEELGVAHSTVETIIKRDIYNLFDLTTI
jgi:uncharacterized membrane protein